MWEIRGPWGEHRGYVVDPQAQVYGLGMILWLVLIGMGCYWTFNAMMAVLKSPGDYSYIYVVASYFYAYTAIYPAMFVVRVMDFFGWLTPWHNLNFVLAWIAAPIYLLFLYGIVAGLFQFLARASDTHPLGLYFVPAFLAGLWGGGTWLLA